MSRPVRALLVKELEHHGVALLLLAALLAFTWCIYWFQLTAAARVLTLLELAPRFALLPLVVAALILGHRLVVTEYYGRTQRFVETLPVAAGRMELVKYLLGLSYLIAIAAGVLLASATLAMRYEPLDGRFMAIMSARLAAYVFALWSFVFAMGFLGRMRIPLYVVLALAVMLIDNWTRFEIMRFGPLAAVDPATFGFEREHLPARALIESTLLGCVFVALGFGLARMREGSLVEQLAKPMTHREKAFLFFTVLCAGLAGFSLGDKPPPQPFRFSSEQVLRDGDGQLAIAYLDERGLTGARDLFDYLQPRVHELWQALNAEEAAPALRIALTPAARADYFDTVYTDRDDGVVLEANFTAAGQFDATRFGAYSVHELLDAYSGGRALFEPRHWLLDGFARYWAEHGAGQPGRLGERFERPVLQALVAARQVPPAASSLLQWDLTSERLGFPMSDAMAYLALRVIVQAHGTEALFALARALLAQPPRNNLAQWWSERRHPTTQIFAATTGWTLGEFAGAWHEQVQALGANPLFSVALARVPHGDASIKLVEDGAVRELVFDVTLEPAPAEDDLCAFAQQPLMPVDSPVDVRSGQLEERLWPVGLTQLRHAQYPSYGWGRRIIAAVDCELSALGVPLRIGVRRMTLR